MNEAHNNTVTNYGSNTSKLFRKYNDWQISAPPEKIKGYYNNNFIKNTLKNKSQHAFFEIPNQLWDMEILSLGMRQNKVFPPDYAWQQVEIKDIQKWDKLNYNQSDYVNCGGSVKLLAWCPNLSDQRQILAIYTSMNGDNIDLDIDPQDNNDFIQIWDFGPYDNRHSTPILLHRFKHQWGYITSMQWISPDEPSVESVQKYPYLNKDFVKPQALFGHILFCCTDGFMRICSIPKFSADQMKDNNKKTLVFNPDYILKVGVGHDYLYDSRQFFGYPTCASWNSSFPGWFVAGYSTGHIGIFDLTCANLFHYDCKHHYLISIHKRKLSLYPITSISMSPYDWQVFNYTVDSGEINKCTFVHKFTEQTPPQVVVDCKEVVLSCVWPFRSDLMVTVPVDKNRVQITSLMSGRMVSVPIDGIVSVVPHDADNSLLVCTEAGAVLSISFNEPAVVRRLMGDGGGEDLIEATSIRHYRLAATPSDNSRHKDRQTIVDSVLQDDPSASPATRASITAIGINPNVGATDWVAVALQCGLVHLLQIVNKETTLTAMENDFCAKVDIADRHEDSDTESHIPKNPRANVRVTAPNTSTQNDPSPTERKIDILSIIERENLVEMSDLRSSNNETAQAPEPMEHGDHETNGRGHEMSVESAPDEECSPHAEAAAAASLRKAEAEARSPDALRVKETVEVSALLEQYIESPVCEEHPKGGKIVESSTVFDGKEKGAVRADNNGPMEGEGAPTSPLPDSNNSAKIIQVVFDVSDLNVDYDLEERDNGTQVDDSDTNSTQQQYEDIEESLEMMSSSHVVASQKTDNIFDRLSKSLRMPSGGGDQDDDAEERGDLDVSVGDEKNIAVVLDIVTDEVDNGDDACANEKEALSKIDGGNGDGVAEPAGISCEKNIDENVLIDVESVCEQPVTAENVPEAPNESGDNIDKCETGEALTEDEPVEGDVRGACREQPRTDLNIKISEFDENVFDEKPKGDEIDGGVQGESEVSEFVESVLEENPKEDEINKGADLEDAGKEETPVVAEEPKEHEVTVTIDREVLTEAKVERVRKDVNPEPQEAVKRKRPPPEALDNEAHVKKVKTEAVSEERHSDANTPKKRRLSKVVTNDDSDVEREREREEREVARAKKSASKKKGRHSAPVAPPPPTPPQHGVPDKMPVVDLSVENMCEAPTLSGKKGGRKSASQKWWVSKKVTLAWTEGRYKSVQQTVTGKLFDEEPVVGQISKVRWSKPTSQSKYPAMVIEIVD